ncbi:hypothetical protein [Streptomyces swartbergensis]|uniref:HNH endonuclease n=1 Tax=Streptomyces swartbergensis TaxID=487165 RepID=A0A243S619_9ACTN|nr:hypothetical protein [Streptomyces swartbergensis]OUD03024.1 hypothetical protein CA983_11880 [Streptomyces swartbergensis]
MDRPPIVASVLYKTVVDAAGGHCQCHFEQPGGCGRNDHPVTGRSCYERPEYKKPLIVAPLDPDTPTHVAVTLGAEDLIVLCRACFTRRTNNRKKAREQAAAEQLAADVLF